MGTINASIAIGKMFYACTNNKSRQVVGQGVNVLQLYRQMGMLWHLA
jgi:hypothetical protein